MEDQKSDSKRPRGQSYSEQFKRKVIEEYLRTGVSKMYLLNKYGIRYKSGIQKWMRDLGYTDLYAKASSLDINNRIEMARKFSMVESNEDDKQSMAKRIKELEKQLDDERLKSEAYNRMIEIAEKELKVSIRKKANTK